jgi:hypothetical protein
MRRMAGTCDQTGQVVVGIEDLEHASVVPSGVIGEEASRREVHLAKVPGRSRSGRGISSRNWLSSWPSVEGIARSGVSYDLLSRDRRGQVAAHPPTPTTGT